MSSKDVFAEYPAEIKASAERPGMRYVRAEGYYGVLDDEKIAVFKGESGEGGSAVYRLEPGGAMAVPTGKVFLRLAEGIEVDDRREEIDGAGYEIAERLSYAPNAAWLRARSGRVADALKGLGGLESLPGVENVEPQMLMARAQRR